MLDASSPQIALSYIHDPDLLISNLKIYGTLMRTTFGKFLPQNEQPNIIPRLLDKDFPKPSKTPFLLYLHSDSHQDIAYSSISQERLRPIYSADPKRDLIAPLDPRFWKDFISVFVYGMT